MGAVATLAPQLFGGIVAQVPFVDTRVLYVEPAKWIARLRAVSTGSPPILLRAEMDAGHGGRSGRYDAWREVAFTLAWELDTLGVGSTAAVGSAAGTEK